MAAIAVDTHAIVWYPSLNPRLSARAAEALDMATLVGGAIHVPSICLVELTYLIEKGRVPAAARQRPFNAIRYAAPSALFDPNVVPTSATSPGPEEFRHLMKKRC
jgi:PIN domain nuclease of toxin-antitoxin system